MERLITDLASIAALSEELDALHRARLPERFAATAGATRSDDHLLGLVQDPTGALLLADATGDVVGPAIAEANDGVPADPLCDQAGQVRTQHRTTTQVLRGLRMSKEPPFGAPL